MIRINLFVGLLLLISTSVSAQYYENGQDPFSINWKKIETPHFKVIFSEDATSTGKMYAAYLEKIYLTGGLTLDHNPRKIPVIIHNQNVVSNGEVAWAPRRMNLYAVPPQTAYAESYAKHLALHEFRHVVQIDKLNQSSIRAFYFVFGEQIIGAFLGWHVPLWFLEGDAVAYETGASNSGRGREPDFVMQLKAQVEHMGVFSYPKAQFGSYKHFVPDHYKLGYELVARTNEKYGDSVWMNTLLQVAKSPIHPNAFSKGIKKATGLPERKLYKTLMFDLKSESTNSFETNNKEARSFSSFYSPYQYGNNTYSYKTSYDDIPRIVSIGEGNKEKKVRKTGYIFNQTFSMQDSIMVWNELKRTRWENDNYTRIVKYNVLSGKKEYLTKKTRAYHSRISPDKTQILSVEVNKDLTWYISIRDAANGQLIKKIKLGKDQVLQPSWSPDMKEIVYLSLGGEGKSLGILNLESQKTEWIITDQYLNLDNPIHYGESILIKGVFNNASNLLEYKRNEKEWFSITNAEYGVGEGRLFHDSLVYSNYTAYGYKISKQNKSTFTKSIKQPNSFSTKESNKLVEQEVYADLNLVDTNFNVENYARLKNLINIHSWAPLSINIQNIELNPGITVMSQNAISTSTLTGGYAYQMQENTQTYYVNYSYKGFYPILNVGFSSNYHSMYIEEDDEQEHLTRWNETILSTSATLPFVFDRGPWFRRLQVMGMYDFNSIKPNSENDIKYKESKSHRFLYLGYFSNLQQTSYRDLQPRWGQTLQLQYMHSPFDMSQFGALASGEVQLYFPGFVKNHGLKLYAGYQRKVTGDYQFSDQVNYPYGYGSQKNTEMVSYQAYYKLPLLYPDLNLWEYLYVKRFKTTLFYQTAYFQYNENMTNLKSAGFDITTDFHAFRFVFPFEIGMRYARRLNYSDNYYQILINMSF